MLIRLIKSEWQRFFLHDKILILSLILFFTNLAVAYYFSSEVNLAEKNSSNYPSLMNYPILFLSEFQSTLFNFFIILFTGHFFFKECDYGYVNYILLRQIKKSSFYISKLIVFYLFLFYIYFILFISSYLSGFLILENLDKVKFFLIEVEYGFYHWVKNTCIFYLLQFVSTVSFSSFLIFLNYFIKNSFYSIIYTLFYLFLNIIFPYLKNTFLYLVGLRNEDKFKYFEYMSVTQIQQDGIVRFINTGDNSVIIYLIFLTIPVFIVSSKLYIMDLGK